MGKLSASATALNASAKRTPLSLKRDRRNTPVKCFSGVGKENQTHGNTNIMRATLPAKKTMIADCKNVEDESVERRAVRRRVEEAVAQHLAQRGGLEVELPATTSNECAVVIADESELEVDSDSVCFADKNPASSKRFTILAMLLVIAMAIWSGVRVVLLEPNHALIKYYPLNSHMFESPIIELDFSVLAIHEVEETFVMPEAPIEQKEVSAHIDLYLPDSAPEVGEKDVVDAYAGGSDVVIDSGSSCVDDNLRQEGQELPALTLESAEAVLVIAAPHKHLFGHTQLALHKAFDLLRPLKKLMAKLQNKVVKLIHGVTRFFSSSSK